MCSEDVFDEFTSCVQGVMDDFDHVITYWSSVNLLQAVVRLKRYFK